MYRHFITLSIILVKLQFRGVFLVICWDFFVNVRHSCHDKRRVPLLYSIYVVALWNSKHIVDVYCHLCAEDCVWLLRELGMRYCYNLTWPHSDLKLDQMIVVKRVCVRIVGGVGFDCEGLRFNYFRIQRWHIVDFEHSAACF